MAQYSINLPGYCNNPPGLAEVKQEEPMTGTTWTISPRHVHQTPGFVAPSSRPDDLLDLLAAWVHNAAVGTAAHDTHFRPLDNAIAQPPATPSIWPRDCCSWHGPSRRKCNVCICHSEPGLVFQDFPCPATHFLCTVFAMECTPLPEMWWGAPLTTSTYGPECTSTPYMSLPPSPATFYNEVCYQLDEDVAKGIIKEVPAGEPTESCMCMVMVPQIDGRSCRTVNFQKLNRACLCETHHSRLPFNLITSIPKHTYKTVTDAFAGYHEQ
ncbi:hypothetical protein E2C01_039545 [Portunus trituberculatus]|uniref:Uncharacterized protein n=1 Tax=Portunus trituberculatus TaxID=210409 RepID=A0A5B7FL15_PORTR|nr:hypothetical protein [Portunus trituberculatus]